VHDMVFLKKKKTICTVACVDTCNSSWEREVMFIKTTSGNLEIHKDSHGPSSTVSSFWEKSCFGY
jgi:hypothetical protein